VGVWKSSIASSIRSAKSARNSLTLCRIAPQSNTAMRNPGTRKTRNPADQEANERLHWYVGIASVPQPILI
jgi:hypothetical protein